MADGANGEAVTAVANSGYTFTDWSDGSTANPRTDTAVSADISVTARFADSQAPTISDLNVDANDSGATMTWTTNEASDSKIYYGPISARLWTISSSTLATSHSLSLTGLASCSKYFYRVSSVDASANTTTSNLSSFDTTGCAASTSITDSGQDNIATSTGGSLSHDNLTLEVPADFTDATSSASFQINKLDTETFFRGVNNPSGKSRGANVYNLKAFSNASTTIPSFSSALSVTISYTDDEVASIDESSLWIYRYDGSDWYALSNCSVNTSANTVTCETSNFSDFAIFGNEKPASSPSPTTVSVSSAGTSLANRIANLEALGLYDEARKVRLQYANILVATQVLTIASPSPLPITATALPSPQPAHVMTLPENKVPSPAPSTLSEIERDLTLGAEGSDVKKLQDFLIEKATGPSALELKRVGATGYFGPYTKNALGEFQKALRIEPWAGYFGPITKTAILFVKGNY